MISKARLLLFLLLPLLISQSALAKKTFDWQVATRSGRQYIPLEKVKTFYGFGSLKKSGRAITLSRKGINLKFRAGGQEVLMNGVKFIFSNAIISIGGKYHVSLTDLKKVVDPILRPTYIKNAQPFDTVVIDPGHGGRDAGASSSLGHEAYYNLKVARLLKQHLLKHRFKVVMTRESDKFLTLGQRVGIANKYKNAIFVSIHFNSVGGAGRSRARGIETFTLSPQGVAHYGRSLKKSDFQLRQGNYQDAANIGLATAVHWGTLQSLQRRGMDMRDRGIRRARFSVLTGVKHPAILIEGGFLSHPTEKHLIHSSAFQKTMAKAICDSIIFYRQSTIKKQQGRQAARPR